MTPRENFLAYFKNEKYEWTPTSADLKMFMPAGIPENVVRGFVIQQNPFSPENFGGHGWFGVDWIFDANSMGSMETNRLLDEISEWQDKVVFPDLDSYDWEGMKEENKDFLNTDKLINSWVFTGYFERLISLLGFEEAAISLIDEDLQDDVHEFFDKLTDFYIDYIGRLHKYFNVEMITFHDDWGSQRALMISRETHREMIMPYIKRIVKACHDMDLIYEQHSCGLVEDLIPSMIEAGTDTWMGQQCCDKYKLVNEYGDKMTFGVELPFPPDMSTEDMLAIGKDAAQKYKGRHVWFAIMSFAGWDKIKAVADAIRDVMDN